MSPSVPNQIFHFNDPIFPFFSLCVNTACSSAVNQMKWINAWPEIWVHWHWNRQNHNFWEKTKRERERWKEKEKLNIRHQTCPNKLVCAKDYNFTSQFDTKQWDKVSTQTSSSVPQDSSLWSGRKSRQQEPNREDELYQIKMTRQWKIRKCDKLQTKTEAEKRVRFHYWWDVFLQRWHPPVVPLCLPPTLFLFLFFIRPADECWQFGPPSQNASLDRKEVPQTMINHSGWRQIAGVDHFHVVYVSQSAINARRQSLSVFIYLFIYLKKIKCRTH